MQIVPFSRALSLGLNGWQLSMKFSTPSKVNEITLKGKKEGVGRSSRSSSSRRRRRAFKDIVQCCCAMEKAENQDIQSQTDRKVVINEPRLKQRGDSMKTPKGRRHRQTDRQTRLKQNERNKKNGIESWLTATEEEEKSRRRQPGKYIPNQHLVSGTIRTPRGGGEKENKEERKVAF